MVSTILKIEAPINNPAIPPIDTKNKKTYVRKPNPRRIRNLKIKFVFVEILKV